MLPKKSGVYRFRFTELVDIGGDHLTARAYRIRYDTPVRQNLVYLFVYCYAGRLMAVIARVGKSAHPRSFTLYVRVHGLYVRELASVSLHGDTAPTVVHAEGLVLDASDDAGLRGVVPGMPVGQARALLSGARFVPCQPEFYRAAQRRWLDALVPYSDRLEPLSLHEAALDLSGHPRPEEVARHALAALARIEPRVSHGVGPAAWIARIAADRTGDALADAAAFLAPLPPAALPIDPRILAKLEGLGCATIGAVQSLSWPTLRRQLGPEGGRVHNLAHGVHRDRGGALYPEDALTGSVVLDGGSESREEILAACRDLAARLGPRLESTDRETPELFLHVGHEDRSVTLERPFARPIRDARTLSAALSLLVAEGFAEPVWSLRATLPRLKAVRSVQPDLFALREQGSGALDGPIAGLQTAFGEDVVRAASSLHVPRRLHVLRAHGSVYGWS